MQTKMNRILVTSFASNVTRMETIFYCAKKLEDLYVWLEDQ